MISYVDPPLSAENEMRRAVANAILTGALPPDADPEKVVRELVRRLTLAVPDSEFLLAFPRERETVVATWKDWGVDHRALRPEYLSYAVDASCPMRIDEDDVNSIVRPTLPPIDLVTMRSL